MTAEELVQRVLDRVRLANLGDESGNKNQYAKGWSDCLKYMMALIEDERSSGK